MENKYDGRESNNEKIKLIKVENGDVFIGTIDHWKDCFFSNPNDTNIKEFCKEQKWKVEILYEEV